MRLKVLRRPREGLMSAIFSWVVSAAVILPLLSLVIVFFLVRIFVENKKKSILWTVDLSTFIFILSVHFHLLSIFKQSYLLYILLLLIGLLAGVFFLEYKKTKVPSMFKVTKKMWRLTFLLFFIGYIFLAFYGITTGVIRNAF